MHRVRQFASHVGARVRPEDYALAREVLPPAAWPLFAAMPVADRRHAIDVAERLRAGGHTYPDLLVAALLHDAAKGRRMRLWHRVSGVLLDAVAPGLLRRLASEDPRSWRHPFWLYLHHARLSADLAVGAGCSPATARLISGEVLGDPEARLLVALKAADDAS